MRGWLGLNTDWKESLTWSRQQIYPAYSPISQRGHTPPKKAHRRGYLLPLTAIKEPFSSGCDLINLEYNKQRLPTLSVYSS